jgi:hypothetical protein
MSATDQSGPGHKGRGRLSSIDMLPDEAEEAIVWALEALRERKLPQNVILEEFNQKLLDLNHDHQLDPPIEPISKSAFNRYAVRKALLFRRIDEAQQVGRELVHSLDPKTPEEVTVALAELIKAAAFEILEDGKSNEKGLMELSRAVATAVNAQKASADYRARQEREVKVKLAEAAAKIGKIGEERGISPDAMKKINRALGVAG